MYVVQADTRQPPPGIPNPAHEFLLVDTDCIPFNLHTSTLAEAFGTPSPEPALADTDSCAIPGHGEVVLPALDMVVRCEGSPFSGMDFNEAFRIASSSFARYVWWVHVVDRVMCVVPL